MSDSEDFLKRWSRRKRQAAEPESDPATDPAPAADGVPGEAPKARKESAVPVPAKAPAKKSETPEPVFDLSSLPPIESIAATTDIRPFLAPGVPAELMRAALRRAWAADPAIRDYIGLSENSWDFNAPGVPGFDHGPPTGDIKRMVAQIFGEKSPDNESPDQSLAASTKPLSAPDEAGASAKQAEAASHCIVNEQNEARTEANPKRVSDQMIIAQHNEEDIATQHDHEEHETIPPPSKRGHGGALPE